MAEANAERILDLLKTQGPQTAAALADTLGITSMGARQHLARLAEQQLVAYEDERRSVGRPKRHWRLADKAQARFPDGHAQMTVEILGAVRSVFGDAGLDRLIAERGRDTLARYRDALRSARGLPARAKRLAEIRSAEGYMAECRREPDGGLLLIENHCPVCAAATACKGLCRSELAIFRAALDGATVERTDHLLAGARRCAYRIRPRRKRR